ncbi:clostripain-related cysteine peptidase [candidate division CSSED10-310 bacterium]|uniref:Clostripain-related cysteine peptidase n=1 Tax=candidate division CSSED10-310 bacterium TaxID=2855610 RepID=A0ABV6Z0D2_UNCC1
MKNPKFLITLTLFLFILVGFTANASATKWTVLVFLNGDNNLESYGISDFLEMATVGSSADIDIIVQFDRASGYSTANGNWTDCRRFRVTKNMTPDPGNALQTLGEVDMGDPQTLADFVKWGINNYPADRYFVDVWNHGGGWTREEGPVIRDCSNDDSSGNSIGVADGELRGAAQQIYNHLGRKVDLWGFDCCLMHMLEVNYELKDYVSYMVASEEVEGANGWDYAAWLDDLDNNPNAGPATLGQYIAYTYYQSGDDTQSVSDLSKVNATTSALTDFSLALIAARAAGHSGTISTILNATQDYYISTYIDLYDFTERCYNGSLPTDVHTTAQALMNALDDQIVCSYNASSHAASHGVSIYHPSSSSSYDSDYDLLQLSANCSWDEYISNEVPPYQPTGTVHTENPNVAIPDNNATGVSDTMFISQSKTINEINLYVNIDHTYIGDLKITLASPSTTTVIVHNRSGGSADDIEGWYDPELTSYESLSAFNSTNCYGTWTITVSDHANIDTGTLKSWKIEVK